MQVKSVLLLMAVCLLGCSISAQQVKTYVPLKATGDIPDEFLSTSTYKYLEQRKTISKKDKKYLKKAQRDFYLQSNYAADELLLSGKVLFNDTLSRYIQKVADILLQKKPEIRNQLRFYVLKSPIPNAFTTHRGTIFINIGLMARLENEAQLAYILAHEIAHYTHKHVLKRFVNDRENHRFWKSSESEIVDTKLIFQNDYTRDSESEADLAGLELLKQTSYNCEKILGVFDVLHGANKPYMTLNLQGDELANTYINTLRFSDWNLQVSRSLDASISKNPKGQTDEALQTYLPTHPDPMWRKRIIRSELPTNNSKSIFLVSEKDFNYLKAIAEYELCNLYLSQAAYFDALYQILGMIERGEKDTTFLDLAMSKALYGIAKYKTAQKPVQSLLTYDNHLAYKTYIQHFLDTLSIQRTVLLSFTNIWEILQKYPTQPYYAVVIRDLFDDLSKTMPPLSEIKNQHTIETQALYQLFQEEAFQLLYEEVLFSIPSNIEQPQPPKRKRKRKKEKIGYQLGIDKIVVFNPRYSRIDRRPGQKGIQPLISERHQGLLDSYILSSGQDLDLEVVLLDTRFMAPESNDTTFNDIALLSEWHHEKIVHENVEMICSNYDRVLPLSRKYQTPYFVHMGAVSMRSPIEMGPRLKWLALLVAPPLWPYGIYEMVKPREASMFYSLVYDIQKDKRIAIMSDVFNNRMQDKELYDRIFEDLRQIKQKP